MALPFFFECSQTEMTLIMGVAGEVKVITVRGSATFSSCMDGRVSVARRFALGRVAPAPSQASQRAESGEGLQATALPAGAWVAVQRRVATVTAAAL